MQKITLGASILALILSVFVVATRNSGDAHPAVEAETNKPRILQRDSSEGSGARIAYLRGDSLNVAYQFILDQQDELISSSKLSEGKLQRSLQKAEQEYAELMNYVQSGGASEDEMQIAQQRIMQLQYELQGMEQEEQMRLAKKEQAMQEEIVLRLNSFLERFATDNGIDLIMNRGISGEGVLYGNSGFDVTKEVLDGLNAEYALEKTAAQPAAK